MDRAQNVAEELEDIRKIVGVFFDAWNRRDVPKIMSVFSEDADVVNSLGLWWSGLSDVTRGLAAMNAIGPSLTPDSVSARRLTRDAVRVGRCFHYRSHALSIKRKAVEQGPGGAA